MAKALAAPPPMLDPLTRRLILLLPVAFLPHDVGELAGNDQLNQAAHDLTRRFPILAQRVLSRHTVAAENTSMNASRPPRCWPCPNR
jgi:hypothetical protein